MEGRINVILDSDRVYSIVAAGYKIDDGRLILSNESGDDIALFNAGRWKGFATQETVVNITESFETSEVSTKSVEEFGRKFEKMMRTMPNNGVQRT
jgi:hypothetical protein